MVMERLLEFLGPEQGVGEVGEEAQSHDASEPIVEDHGTLLESVAGVGVSDRSCEEGKTERD
jgi:hypothetical protein